MVIKLIKYVVTGNVDPWDLEINYKRISFFINEILLGKYAIRSREKKQVSVYILTSSIVLPRTQITPREYNLIAVTCPPKRLKKSIPMGSMS